MRPILTVGLGTTLCCWLAATALAESPPSAPAKPTLVVVPLRVIGVAAPGVMALTAQIADEINRRGTYRAVTSGDLDRIAELEQDKQRLGCAGDDQCLSRLAALSHADRVVSGSVGQIGANIVVSLSLLNSSLGTVGSSSETLGSLDDLPAAVPALVDRLLGVAVRAPGPRFRLPSGTTTAFAVSDLAASGVAPELARNLTGVLSSTIKQIEGTSVISSDDVGAMLELQETKARMGCLSDTSCIAEIGGALGVDKVLVGGVGRLANSYVVTLSLVDARQVQVDNRVTEVFGGEEEQLIRAVRYAAHSLLGLESLSPGRLAISANQTEAEVFLDEKSLGLLPLPPVAELRPGRHAVRLSKGGYVEWRSDVYVDPGDTTALWAVMQAEPERWYQKWWVWTAVGVALAAGTTATVWALTRPAAEGSVVIPFRRQTE